MRTHLEMFARPIVLFLLASMAIVGCATVAERPTPVSVAAFPTATFTSSPVPTGTMPRSPCVSSVTPQPTMTPMVSPPTAAFFPRSPEFPGITGISGLRDTKFHSALLDRDMPIFVYLPPGYFDSTGRYPVLYLLSGFAGAYHEWVNWGICDALEWLTRGGYIQPFIVVLPEGDNSFWFNHAAVPGSDGRPWGDYIWHDVVNYVDSTYRTMPTRESRAIGGLSAGGQAAMELGMNHPDIFSIVGAHSPSVRHADGSLVFFGDQDYFNQYDPLWLFQNTTTWKDLTLWIDAGAEDTQWGGPINDLHKLLVDENIPHEFHNEWHGIHDNYYWGAHTPDYLLWYSSKLIGAETR